MPAAALQPLQIAPRVGAPGRIPKTAHRGQNAPCLAASGRRRLEVRGAHRENCSLATMSRRVTVLPQSQSCTKGGGGWSVLDYIPSFDLPSLPEGLVNFSAGLGDALLFGLGNPARDLLGINGSVDRSAGAYEGGSWTSFGFGAGRLGYAVAVKGYSVAASSGAAASAFRASMRMPGAPVRDLTKYTTDAALRAAAGRSNPLVNAAGAGVAAAGAHGATVGCP